jgi:hypothetical protein
MPDDKKSNVIDLAARRKKSVPEQETIVLGQEAVHDIILAVAIMNKMSSVRDDCKDNIEEEKFPCDAQCACYLHMISSMALEVIFDGEKAKQASAAINIEYLTLDNDTSEEDSG